jgi:hypothetical protein
MHKCLKKITTASQFFKHNATYSNIFENHRPFFKQGNKNSVACNMERERRVVTSLEKECGV